MYTDIISLEEAKVYLRIDDTLTEDDFQITRMIKGALSFIEQYTNYIFFPRDKDYRLINGCVRVYDYPINSEVTTELEVTNKTLYNIYQKGDNNDLITLNVGYVDPLEIPQELLEVALVMIKNMYYEKENNKTLLDGLDTLSKITLENYKRFIL
jgi:hypothetical protein